MHIKNSLKKNKKIFFLLNNGITMLVDKLKFNDNNRISFTNYNIINGQQTLRTLYEVFLEGKNNNIDLNNVIILIKIYELKEETLKLKIPFATNNQNKIDVKDLMSLNDFQKNVRDYLINKDVFYIYKKGVSKVNESKQFFNNSITLDEVIKLFAICYDKKLVVKNNTKDMFDQIYKNIGQGTLSQNDDYYHTEEAISSLNRNNKEALSKMWKLIFIYNILKSKTCKDIWKEKNKSFDVVIYVTYMLIKNEKNEQIKKLLSEKFTEIWKILKAYFDKKIDKNEADFFRTKENWIEFAKEIETICLDNEDYEKKIILLENYLTNI